MPRLPFAGADIDLERRLAALEAEAPDPGLEARLLSIPAAAPTTGGGQRMPARWRLSLAAACAAAVSVALLLVFSSRATPVFAEVVAALETVRTATWTETSVGFGPDGKPRTTTSTTVWVRMQPPASDRRDDRGNRILEDASGMWVHNGSGRPDQRTVYPADYGPRLMRAVVRYMLGSNLSTTGSGSSSWKRERIRRDGRRLLQFTREYVFPWGSVPPEVSRPAQPSRTVETFLVDPGTLHVIRFERRQFAGSDNHLEYLATCDGYRYDVPPPPGTFEWSGARPRSVMQAPPRARWDTIDTQGMVPGNPERGVADLLRIYQAIQVYRSRHGGRYPSKEEFMAVLRPRDNAYGLTTMDLENPDVQYSEGGPPPGWQSERVTFVPYSILPGRPDGTPLGSPKAPGTRDLLAYTRLYFHQNIKNDHRHQKSTVAPVGFFLVLWDDGTVERVPWERGVLYPSDNRGRTEGISGQAGLPAGAITYPEHYRQTLQMVPTSPKQGKQP